MFSPLLYAFVPVTGPTAVPQSLDMQTIALIAALGLLAFAAYRRFGRKRQAPSVPAPPPVFVQAPAPQFDLVAAHRQFELQVQEKRRYAAIEDDLYSRLNPKL